MKEQIPDDIAEQIEKEGDQWEFVHNGLTCVAMRSSSAYLCGYVLVGKDHPLFGVQYSEEIPALSDDGAVQSLEDVIDVHGGVTYTGAFRDFPDKWAIGFDCAHCDDFMSSTIRLRDGIYRNKEYVDQQMRSLADQIVALGERINSAKQHDSTDEIKAVSE